MEGAKPNNWRVPKEQPKAQTKTIRSPKEQPNSQTKGIKSIWWASTQKPDDQKLSIKVRNWYVN